MAEAFPSVLFVITRGDSIGGGQIHVRDLCAEAARRGIRAAVAVGSTGDLTKDLDAQGTRWYEIPGLVRSIHPGNDFKAISALRSAIKDFRPDLVSCHTAKAGLVGRIAAFLEGVPSIFTAHGWQFADGIGGAQKLAVLASEYVCARLCSRIICVSRYDYDLAKKRAVAGPGKLRLVHNGMPDRPVPPPRPAGGRPARLVMIARFQDQKDHGTLFKALAGLMDRDWRLDLVGDGPLQEKSSALAESLGIADRVDFLGQRMDAPEILDRADAFVLASNWEGFPRSILEAMRSALPVVASDVGGCRESVADGVTGYLVPRGDAAILGARLAALIDDPALRDRLGAAGRASFEARFSFASMFEATRRVWNEAVGREAFL